MKMTIHLLMKKINMKTIIGTLKMVIYFFNVIYRKYYDFPKNWHKSYNYEKDTSEFYKKGKIIAWEKYLKYVFDKGDCK